MAFPSPDVPPRTTGPVPGPGPETPAGSDPIAASDRESGSTPGELTLAAPAGLAAIPVAEPVGPVRARRPGRTAVLLDDDEAAALVVDGVGPQYVVLQPPPRTHRGLVLALGLMLLAGGLLAVRVSVADWHWGWWGRTPVASTLARLAAPLVPRDPAQAPAVAGGGPVGGLEAVAGAVVADAARQGLPAADGAPPVVAQPVEAVPADAPAVAAAPAPAPAPNPDALAAQPAEPAVQDEIAQEAERIRAEREALEKLKQQEGEKIAQEPARPQFPQFGGGGFRIIIPGPNGGPMGPQHQQMLRELDAQMARQMAQFNAEFEAMARAQDQMVRQLQARAQAQARARARGGAAGNPAPRNNGGAAGGNPAARNNGGAAGAGAAGRGLRGGGFENRGFDPMLEAQRDFERFAGQMMRDMLREDALRAAPFAPPAPGPGVDGGADEARPAPRLIPLPPAPGLDAEPPADAPRGARPRTRNEWIRSQTQA